eukprot:gene7189-9803_t
MTSAVLADPWDLVINVEEEVFKQGFNDATNNVSLNQSFEDDDVEVPFEEGYNVGFVKGYAYGMELEYMKKIIELFLDNKNDINNNNEKFKIRKQQELYQRITNCIDLLLIHEMNQIDERKQEIDFDQEILSIRSIFKLYNKEVGPLLLPSIQNTSQEW